MVNKQYRCLFTFFNTPVIKASVLNWVTHPYSPNLKFFTLSVVSCKSLNVEIHSSD